MHFAALCGSQAWNSPRSLSGSIAPGCFSSPEGGATSIWVCLLELSSGASVSERGGSLRLSLGLGADLSTGTRVMGPSSSLLCAQATPDRHNPRIARMRIRNRTLIFYCNPKFRRKTRLRCELQRERPSAKRTALVVMGALTHLLLEAT